MKTPLATEPVLEVPRDGELPYLVEHWYLASRTRRYMIVRRIREVLESAGFRAGDRVLDLGPGWSYGPLWASHSGARVTGVDLGLDQLRWAQMALNSSRRFALVQANAKALPFRDQSFDAIVSAEMMEHVFRPDRPGVLREAARVLRPGGSFAISTPNPHSPIELVKTLAVRWPALRRRLPSGCFPEASDDAGQYHPYRYHHPIAASELARGLEAAGFLVRGVRHFLFVAKTLPDSLLSIAQATERVAEALPLIRGLGATTLVWGTRR